MLLMNTPGEIHLKLNRAVTTEDVKTVLRSIPGVNDVEIIEPLDRASFDALLDIEPGEDGPRILRTAREELQEVIPVGIAFRVRNRRNVGPYR